MQWTKVEKIKYFQDILFYFKLNPSDFVKSIYPLLLLPNHSFSFSCPLIISKLSGLNAYLNFILCLLGLKPNLVWSIILCISSLASEYFFMQDFSTWICHKNLVLKICMKNGKGKMGNATVSWTYRIFLQSFNQHNLVWCFFSEVLHCWLLLTSELKQSYANCQPASKNTP